MVVVPGTVGKFPFPKGVSEEAGIVSALPTELFGDTVPAIEPTTSGAGSVDAPPFSEGTAVAGDIRAVLLISQSGIDVSTGPPVVVGVTTRGSPPVDVGIAGLGASVASINSAPALVTGAFLNGAEGL